MPVLKIKTIAESKQEGRRQKLVILVLSVICLSGFSYVIYDYIQITNRAIMPEAIADVDPFLKQLEAEGLVSSLDVAQARLTVSEQKWRGLSYEEKLGMVTQLARYCAEKNNSDVWAITVFGQQTSAKLGELGMMGLIVN